MKVKKVLEAIEFNISTLNDLSGKSINRIFSDKDIVRQLNFSLLRYSSETLALEGIHTFTLDTKIQYAAIPELALRSRTYRMIVVYVQGVQYVLDIANLNNIQAYFPYSFQGLPNWVLPWADKLYFFPTNGTSFAQTTLFSTITDEDTTITVSDASALPLQSGYVTIGTEKVSYNYRTGNVFYQCVRGAESTTAEAHSAGDAVIENNCHIFYFKRHFEIPVSDKGVVDKTTLDREMEVCDEHIQVITDYASYKLLSKTDASRAAAYKVDFDEWLIKVSANIKQGRSKITNTGNIRAPYMTEQKVPYFNFI